ncbi:hypothetical protein [Streptomyces radicis]|uniref:Uncharacterized protein n=1 Tax=Streptomyces radicis TaxID=1750517 RepID=A0A3A9VTH5_9ACTN|nr:hypothetical protein D7319_31545 [Streptomyces radicis]RKN13335.1 hypothetical protein D7318_31415 [Streptomyces radicis]
MRDAAGLEPSAAGGHPQGIHYQRRAVAMKVMSPTSLIPGSGAVKSRPSRSGGECRFLRGVGQRPALAPGHARDATLARHPLAFDPVAVPARFGVEARTP